MQLQRHLHISPPRKVFAWVTSWHQFDHTRANAHISYARSRCFLPEVSNLEHPHLGAHVGYHQALRSLLLHTVLHGISLHCLHAAGSLSLSLYCSAAATMLSLATVMVPLRDPRCKPSLSVKPAGSTLQCSCNDAFSSHCESAYE